MKRGLLIQGFALAALALTAIGLGAFGVDEALAAKPPKPSATVAPGGKIVANATIDAAASPDAAAPADPSDPLDAGVPAAPAPPSDAGRVAASCVERLPDGATRPLLTEVFPTRGLSGYAVTLEVTVVHGKGETVLPEGFRVQTDSDAARALKEAGFVFPDPDGGVGPTITAEPSERGAATKLKIPFVALPKDPGRNAMLLPPVPIAVARANGDLVTVCTRVHPILIEDPIANELDPQVKPNPPPRPQREDWDLGRKLVTGIAIGVVLGGLVAFLLLRYLRRPTFVAPPPPRPAWEVALEELDDVRRSALLAEDRTAEYFDRVSDSVRKYLGARYGFDGLESTTDEARARLKQVRPQVPELKKIMAFLGDCDLVKFARVVPDADDCTVALRKGERIVRTTMPRAPRPDGSREGPPSRKRAPKEVEVRDAEPEESDEADAPEAAPIEAAAIEGPAIQRAASEGAASEGVASDGAAIESAASTVVASEVAASKAVSTEDDDEGDAR